MTEEQTTKPITIGVVYSAVTPNYTLEAIKGAKTFKKVCPDIPITLYTDNPKLATPYLGTLLHQVIPIDMAPMKKKGFKLVPYAKLCKIQAMASFPYNITLYLDTDTKIVRPIYELFELGKQHDIIIANSPMLDKRTVPYKLTAYQRPKAYNSGVIVYRQNSNVKNLFKKWIALVLKDKNIYAKNDGKFWDQPKLVKLLNDPTTVINLKVVPNTLYNARHTMLKKMQKDGLYNKVKIIHKH